MDNILLRIRKELKRLSRPAYRKGASRFFKEPVVLYGVPSALVRRIAHEYYKEVEHLPKRELFLLCEELLTSGYFEEQTIAFAYAYARRHEYEKRDFALFEKWLKRYVSNWGACDDFCTHAFGSLLLQFPECIPRVKTWTASKNRWLRRASAVIFISSSKTFYTAKHLKPHVFDIATRLLTDEDDLVQKGYGWMLKALAETDAKAVFNFVMARKHVMPRTALRYAIEKMPKDWKAKAMAR